MGVNETIKNKIKKTPNLIVWFLAWKSKFPLLEEYCANILIIPSTKIESRRTKSKFKILSLKVKPE